LIIWASCAVANDARGTFHPHVAAVTGPDPLRLHESRTDLDRAMQSPVEDLLIVLVHELVEEVAEELVRLASARATRRRRCVDDDAGEVGEDDHVGDALDDGLEPRALAECVFDRVSLRDVTDERVEGVVAVMRHEPRSHLDGDLAPVVPERGELEPLSEPRRLVATEEALHAQGVHDPVTRGEDGHRERLAERLVAGSPEQRFRVRSPFEDRARRIPGDERIVRRLDEFANAVVGGPPPKLGVRAGDELLGFHGFREVVVGAVFEAVHTVAQIGVGGDEDHRQVGGRGAGSHALDHVEAAETRRSRINRLIEPVSRISSARLPSDATTVSIPARRRMRANRLRAAGSSSTTSARRPGLSEGPERPRIHAGLHNVWTTRARSNNRTG
jgi:hypothetical protein